MPVSVTHLFIHLISVIMHIINYVFMHKTYISVSDFTLDEGQNKMHRRRRGRKGRLPKPVRIGVTPPVRGFYPLGPPASLEPVYLEPAELEALRLADLEGLSQEEAGERMGISRGTVWRLLQSARKKVAQALTEGRPIRLHP